MWNRYSASRSRVSENNVYHGQVSTFTIGALVVPVVVEAYRANWFPTEDVLFAKTSSHKVEMQSFDQD
jgi:hypothetical protein